VESDVVTWSDELFLILGCDAELGTPSYAQQAQLYRPASFAQLQQAVERALASGEPYVLELEYVQPGGICGWVDARGECVRDAQGRIVGLQGTVQDITTRHSADQRLAAKSHELQRSNEDLERFAYVASHDLQEPLRMVTSYGQLLTRRHLADLKPEAQEFVAYMVDGGQRAQALIRDLLSLARLDSQAKPWTPVALEALLAQALQPLRLRVQETGAKITHDPLPTVVGDAGQLGQLMANLVGNALKFCGKAAPVVHIGALREGSGWRISVRDAGIGIEPRYFDRIFQMFQRLHLRTEYEGTGIGLAICKKVVERHGGHIGVQSTPGQGATFFFTLPDHVQDARPTAAPSPAR
jgi:light-regulated signal transduction histidine kinase (bacteriophytochrome)